VGASTAAEPPPSGLFFTEQPLRLTTKDKVWGLQFLLMYVRSFVAARLSTRSKLTSVGSAGISFKLQKFSELQDD